MPNFAQVDSGVVTGMLFDAASAPSAGLPAGRSFVNVGSQVGLEGYTYSSQTGLFVAPARSAVARGVSISDLARDIALIKKALNIKG